MGCITTVARHKQGGITMQFLVGRVLLSLAVTAAITGNVRAQWDDDFPSRRPSPLSNLHFSISVGGFAPIGDLATASDTSLGGAVSIGVQWGRPRSSRPFVGGIFYEAAGVAR